MVVVPADKSVGGGFLGGDTDRAGYYVRDAGVEGPAGRVSLYSSRVAELLGWNGDCRRVCIWGGVVPEEIGGLVDEDVGVTGVEACYGGRVNDDQGVV